MSQEKAPHTPASQETAAAKSRGSLLSWGRWGQKLPFVLLALGVFDLLVYPIMGSFALGLDVLDALRIYLFLNYISVMHMVLLVAAIVLAFAASKVKRPVLMLVVAGILVVRGVSTLSGSFELLMNDFKFGNSVLLTTLHALLLLCQIALLAVAAVYALELNRLRIAENREKKDESDAGVGAAAETAQDIQKESGEAGKEAAAKREKLEKFAAEYSAKRGKHENAPARSDAETAPEKN
ncbi:MAG: hypothetical protein Q4C71_00130 [Microbacteriaceae bacterium]|nr:hypothetical protein [Microbacteriaceae bacterium]